MCRGCATGFDLSSAGKCVVTDCKANIPNCDTCSVLTTCQTCKAGFSLVAKGTACQEACTDTNCQYCLAVKGKCDVCKPGFSGYATACRADICSISGCDSCKTASTCATCAAAYTINAAGTACTPSCLTSAPNCQKCSSATACEQC